MDNGLGVGRQLGDGNIAKLREPIPRRNSRRCSPTPPPNLVFQLCHESYQKLQNRSGKKSSKGDWYPDQLEAHWRRRMSTHKSGMFVTMRYCEVGESMSRREVWKEMTHFHSSHRLPVQFWTCNSISSGFFLIYKNTNELYSCVLRHNSLMFILKSALMFLGKSRYR